ncbi:MAG: LacI family DNA-binding transcriptional regulator [Actinomycetes bacterium]
MDRGSPTLVDVARAAGVSKSLVSLAIRGDAGVSEATRSRILATAAARGYRSNALARGLAMGRTRTVAVLLSGLRNTYHAEVAQGIEVAAADLGLDTILGQGDNDPATLGRRLDRVLGMGVDGVIVVSALLEPELLDRVDARTPVVMVGRPFRLPERVSVIRNDDEEGVAAAMAHLLDLGHRRIVHVARSTRAAATARRAAYVEAMDRAGLRALTIDANRELDAWLDAVAPSPRDRPTAVVAGNDRVAIAVMHGAQERGLRVPDDLSVVGYDNLELASMVRPALTTVDQPRELMGREAMRLLAERIEGHGRAIEIALAPRLVVRGSTAPAA